MKDSRIVISEVMMPSQANPNGNVHGGEIMKLMDSAAYAAARRYARSNVVTARVDELEFHLPIRIGDLVVVTADIVYVGHSSMEVAVNVIVEDLDDGGDPPLTLDTEEARAAFEEGKRRYEAHKARKRGTVTPTGGCVCDAIAQQAKAANTAHTKQDAKK